MPAQSNIDLSFEVFPAEGEVAKARLARTVRALAPLAPRFVSVTHGANGSAKDRTLGTLDALRIGNPMLGLAGHLVARAGSKGEVLAMASDYEAAGARWIVALRGDPEEGAGGVYHPHSHGFEETHEFVAALRDRTSLRIAVAAYPEGHPESRGWQQEIEHLKRKTDAGADAILTQFFFDNDDFYRFVDRCRAGGIDTPIVPGIMPVSNFTKTARFAQRCGASIPTRIADRFDKAIARGAERDFALAQCVGQVDALREQGVRSFHFYTMNQADLTLSVCRALGFERPAPVDGDPVAVEAEQIREAVSA